MIPLKRSPIHADKDNEDDSQSETFCQLKSLGNENGFNQKNKNKNKKRHECISYNENKLEYMKKYVYDTKEDQQSQNTSNKEHILNILLSPKST